MFEGSEKSKIAVEGIAELSKVVDSVIVVSNDKLMMYEGNTTVNNAFAKADTILARSVKTVTDIIMTPYLMNLDFADVKNVLKDSVVALIGYGQGTGPNKAIDAAESAINCPLLETGILGARRCLCGLTYGPNVTMVEINQTIQKINALAGNQLNIKFALTCNNELDDDILISIIATDFVNAQEILSGESSNNPVKPSTEVKSDDEEVEEYENPDEIITDFLKDEDVNLFNL
jgi:cell division protein FtsZ